MSQDPNRIILATNVGMKTSQIFDVITWGETIQTFFGNHFEDLANDVFQAIVSILTDELMTDFVNLYIERSRQRNFWSDDNLVDEWITNNIIAHPSIQALKALCV